MAVRLWPGRTTCATPIGVHAKVDGGQIEIEAFVHRLGTEAIDEPTHANGHAALARLCALRPRDVCLTGHMFSWK